MLLTDVMGHGVRSAMVTAMIQVAVRQLRQLAVSPAGFMRYLNSILFQCVNQLGQTLFATAVFCYADLISGQMTYVQSGGRHGMISSGGECHQLGGAVGPALGLLPDVTFKEERIDLHAGDRFLLYTDGLIEATAMGEHDREFGDEGIRQSMINYADKRLDQMLVGLLADAITHQGRNKMADDICLLAFEFSAPKC
jgi:sigma-B regulation protein RsbU (phosphoserine phosphatase)